MRDPDVFVSVWPLAVTPVQISLATVSAFPDRVEISWYAGGDPLDQATVQRRDETGDWMDLGVIYVDGTGRLAFTDTGVAAGARYAYRLRIVDGGAERFVGETWVEVPARANLAIDAIRPNPSRRDAWVTFSRPAVSSQASAEKLGSWTMRRPLYTELRTAAMPAT